MATTKTTAQKSAANKARRAEAKPEDATPTTFEFGGREYEVAPEVLDDVELFEKIEDMKYITAARGFVGQAQWADFKNDHREDDGRVPMTHVEDFLQALMQAVGGSGN